MIFEIGEYLPDLPALNNPGATIANNVIPAAGSYRPLPAVSTVGSAAAERIQGAAYFRSVAQLINNFAGSNTNLYKYNGGTLAWDDISRTVGGVYTCGSTEAWSFTQYNDLVVACDGSDAMQSYTMASSTNFAALGGSSPVARFVATIRDFVVAGRISGAANRVQWSALGVPTDWVTSSTTQADQQDLGRGGQVMGIAGGEFGIVWQERAIQRMTYIGTPIIFQFDMIAQDLGCAFENSIASYGPFSFFVSYDGIKMLVAGQQIQDIGKNKWDRSFYMDFDSSYPNRVVGAVDPINSLYMLIYPGSGNSGGTPNRIFIYHWPTGWAATGDISLEWIYTAASQSGYTLDTLDTISGSIDALPASLDSATYSGSGRLALAAFDSTHKWAFFSGSPTAATVETKELQPTEGRRTRLKKAWPLIEGTSVNISVTPITRNRLNDPAVAGTSVLQNASGFVPLRTDARYIRLRKQTAAGDTWDHIRGFDATAADLTASGLR